MTHVHSGCRVGTRYEDGPTTCMAHPSVMRNIKAEIAQARILSSADSRLAALSGMLGTPPVTRSGFNDGVIYPPVDSENVSQVSGRPNLAPSRRFALAPPSSATTLNCLVLLVDFPDNVGSQTQAHYQNLLFDPTNPNSLTSFYKELSYGKLTVQGIVTPWLRAQNPYSHYTAGESGTGTNFPNNVPGLLQEMLQTYCQTGSLAGFDLNGDGLVDGLFLVHAGGGAEAEADATARKSKIWSHKWTLPSAFTNSGVQAFAYFTAPEDGRLGVFAHEFGHFLGLPDLYDTSYRSFGIGDWCLMAGGSWNGDGDVPSRMSAWCLSFLGWIKPKNVIANGSFSLDTLENDRSACLRLWSGGANSKEYFLIENRQKVGRDSELPGTGLAVWHVDETQSDNTNPLAYRVALVQADGRRDLEFNKNQGDPGDLFPGSKKVTSVTGSNGTHPHLRGNDGTSTSVALTNISASRKIISGTVAV